MQLYTFSTFAEIECFAKEDGNVDWSFACLSYLLCLIWKGLWVGELLWLTVFEELIPFEVFFSSPFVMFGSRGEHL